MRGRRARRALHREAWTAAAQPHGGCRCRLRPHPTRTSITMPAGRGVLDRIAAEVERQATARTDAAVTSILQKEMKNRRGSLEEARKANRADLIEDNEAEIRVLEAFLPKAMPAEELNAIVQAAITETGASTPADMGKVMKIVMPKVAGRCLNDMISTTVREQLQK